MSLTSRSREYGTNCKRSTGMNRNLGARSETIFKRTSGRRFRISAKADSILYRNWNPELSPSQPMTGEDVLDSVAGTNRSVSTGVGKTLTFGFQLENFSARN